MCGIVGIVGAEPVAGSIVEALRRLEYRGYDSAGIATVTKGAIARRRVLGKLGGLAASLRDTPLPGDVGIGHTRWATHGVPSEANAHPHATEKVAIVHNGIIENFRALRKKLEAKGHKFESQTDSETIAHLITDHLAEGLAPADAAMAAIKELEGAFALGIVFAGEHNLLVGARRGSPLAVGYGEGAMYLASDALALAPFTSKVAYLEEGDCVVLTRTSAVFRDAAGNIVEREIRISNAAAALLDKGEHRHFMAKEIFEQPEVVGHTLAAYCDPLTEKIRLPALPFDLANITAVTISACGTASYAAAVGKYWIEQLARVAVNVDIASEFRYREPVLAKGGLALFVSQSGETADTLAALRHCKAAGQHVAAIVNVPESTIAREAGAILPTHAGPEIGVASTKAFTCQLMVLACLAIALGRAKGTLSEAEEKRHVRLLTAAPRLMAEALTAAAPGIETLAHDLSRARDVLYLGRGLSFPLALEGALKLKEISYIHAEGYAAGELKHGPIALIDEAVPVIVIAPTDQLFEKTLSNMHEVMARGGRVLLLSNQAGLKQAGEGLWAQIAVPEADPFLSPLIYAIPIQLLAYHTAVAKGTDVDQPRNLAKSVTVE
jgi:glucosamine--fructose-6-phosphate aminotransferase (isomerizing)